MRSLMLLVLTASTMAQLGPDTAWQEELQAARQRLETALQTGRGHKRGTALVIAQLEQDFDQLLDDPSETPLTDFEKKLAQAFERIISGWTAHINELKSLRLSSIRESLLAIVRLTEAQLDSGARAVDKLVPERTALQQELAELGAREELTGEPLRHWRIINRKLRLQQRYLDGYARRDLELQALRASLIRSADICAVLDAMADELSTALQVEHEYLSDLLSLPQLPMFEENPRLSRMYNLWYTLDTSFVSLDAPWEELLDCAEIYLEALELGLLPERLRLKLDAFSERRLRWQGPVSSAWF